MKDSGGYECPGAVVQWLDWLWWATIYRAQWMWINKKRWSNRHIQ